MRSATQLKFVHVDAFTHSPFRGAQIGVCVLSTRLEPEQMRVASQELALPESAFLVQVEEARFEIRAYSAAGVACDPAGTAAMAAGHMLFTEGYAGRTRGLVFDAPTESFRVERRADHTTLTLLPRRVELAPMAPAPFADISVEPVLTNGVDLIVTLADESAVRRFEPAMIDCASWLGERVVVTAPSTSHVRDFVVRTFVLDLGHCVETVVSGAAYRALGPYWLERLNAPILRGEQLDRRGGVVHVEAVTDLAIAISGQCVTTAKSIFTVMP